MIITKHAYKRARQRLGLNRKAFKRAIDNNLLPDYARLETRDNHIVTVKNMLVEERTTKNKINKVKRNKLIC